MQAVQLEIELQSSEETREEVQAVQLEIELQEDGREARPAKAKAGQEQAGQ